MYTLKKTHIFSPFLLSNSPWTPTNMFLSQLPPLPPHISLSPVSVANMCMDVWPSTRMRGTYQWLHSQRKMTSLSQQPSNASSSSDSSRALWSPVQSRLYYWLAWSHVGLVWVTIVVVISWVQQLCHVQKTTFHSTLPHPLALTFFSWPSFCSLGFSGREVIKTPYFRLSTHLHRHLALWPVILLFSLTAAHSKKKLLWSRLKTIQIYGFKHKYLKVSLTMWSFNQVIVDCLLGLAFDQVYSIRYKVSPLEWASYLTRRWSVTLNSNATISPIGTPCLTGWYYI